MNRAAGVHPGRQGHELSGGTQLLGRLMFVVC